MAAVTSATTTNAAPVKTENAPVDENRGGESSFLHPFLYFAFMCLLRFSCCMFGMGRGGSLYALSAYETLSADFVSGYRWSIRMRRHVTHPSQPNQPFSRQSLACHLSMFRSLTTFIYGMHYFTSFPLEHGRNKGAISAV